MVHFLSLWFVPDMANIGLCCPHMPAYNYYQIKKSGNPIGIKPNRNIFIPRLLEKYMPPIWPFGKKVSEYDSEVIIEYISPKGQIMRKRCIRVDCVNPVAIGNINYCSDSCKRADEREYVYSGGMSGNMKPL
tara:strand:+ start:536 stop:931 length:396 start_codon:yes stop_codon:yes gene_type:complete